MLLLRPSRHYFAAIRHFPASSGVISGFPCIGAFGQSTKSPDGGRIAASESATHTFSWFFCALLFLALLHNATLEYTLNLWLLQRPPGRCSQESTFNTQVFRSIVFSWHRLYI